MGLVVLKTTQQFDVTINITAHSEGYYLYRTLESVVVMRKVASKDGINCLIQIHLDNADSLTTEIANKFIAANKDSVVYANHFGDASASRNFLIENTSSKYTLFIDGDDLFTENFISVAYKTAQKFNKPCIVSSEDIVKFDKSIDPYIFRVESTVNKPGIKSALFEMNLYISQNLVTTEIFKNCQYEPNMGNYGFEDWHWNTKAIDKGYEFLVAVDTVFFYRQKPDNKSLLKKNVNTDTVIRPTPLFDPRTFIKLPHDAYSPPEPPQQKERPTLVGFIVAKGRASLKKIPRNGFAFRALRKAYHLTRQLKKGSITQPIIDGITTDEYEYSYSPNQTKKRLWDDMNKIEPSIRLDHTLLAQLKVRHYAHRHNLATTYNTFCKQYGGVGFTDIIFVPWINRGGADLAMLDLARELVGRGGKVLIVTTTGIESQWAEKANAIPGVVFIQSHDYIFKNLDHINIKIFFLRLIQNWNISSMTIMNSDIGFELIERFGHAIKDTGCRIVVHNYAFPVLEGKTVDAFPALTTSLEQVDIIVTDSQFHKDEINKLYGFGLEKIIEVPLMIDENLQKKVGGPTKRILFANRIAREKQPQVAIQTAKLLQNEGIKLDIFGTKDEHFCKEVHFNDLLKDTENVDYKGLFSTSQELNFNDYDICFMPSLYEGTPRIVLESVKAGLYIVCTSVGGMPETVSSRYSGLVLRPEATPREYADAILAYYHDSTLQNLKKRREANRLMLQAHTDENYRKLINSIYRLKGKEI